MLQYRARFRYEPTRGFPSGAIAKDQATTKPHRGCREDGALHSRIAIAIVGRVRRGPGTIWRNHRRVGEATAGILRGLARRTSAGRGTPKPDSEWRDRWRRGKDPAGLAAGRQHEFI